MPVRRVPLAVLDERRKETPQAPETGRADVAATFEDLVQKR